MAVLSKKGYTIKESIESLGIKRVIDELGLKRIIDEYGIERVINEYGLEKLINEYGLEKLIEASNILDFIKYLNSDKGKAQISNLPESDKEQIKEILTNILDDL